MGALHGLIIKSHPGKWEGESWSSHYINRGMLSQALSSSISRKNGTAVKSKLRFPSFAPG